MTRLVEIWRDGGPRAIALKILEQTVYRRMLLIEYPLDQPAATPPPASAGTAIGQLTANEIDDYLAFRPDAEAADVRDRLERGEICFVARHDGRIVSAAWAVSGSAWIGYLGTTMPVEPHEAYLYDSFTLPAFRGQSLPVVRAAYHTRYFRGAGYRRLLAVVVPENRRGVRHAEKVGWKVFGVMGYVKVGPWRRDFRRLRPR